MDTDDYLNDLTDDELLAKYAQVKIDLEAASTDDRESEWHEACFAGALVIGMEALKRGLKLNKVH